MRVFIRRLLAPLGLMLACVLNPAAADAAELPHPAAWRAAPDDAPLRIDGRLDEPAWQQAPVHEAFLQHLPAALQPVPPGYRTTVQIVVEPRALVFGLRAYDPRPQEIRAPLMRRDQVRRDQDFVAVYIDPVGTRRAAQFFRINAAGTVADGVYLAETDTEDFSPDFEFESAVQRTPDGYTVELRVPLLSLRYPYAGGAPWRLMFGRSVPRESSVLLLSAPLSRDSLHFIAEMHTVDGLDDITERVRSLPLLAVRPELTLREARQRDGGTRDRQREASLGAEIKWRPRADWVFDATLNPDFSQVELDVPQLAGNTRFALSVPEKRPFFLESTDVIALPLAAFYSRSITDPGWGLRATYRGTAADASALSLRDDGGGVILLPGPYSTTVAPQDRRSQASLMRGRWHAGALTAGALLSQRDYVGGADNRVAGADVVWHPDESLQLQARALGSTTSTPGGPSENGHHLHLAWWQRLPGWNTTLKWTEISPRFRNDNGFVEQAGARIAEAEVIRRWGEVALPALAGFAAHDFETYLWLQHKGTLADARDGIAGGETIARSVHPGIWWAAARNVEASVEYRLDAVRARAGGQLHPVRLLAWTYGINPAPWFTRLTVEGSYGRRLDVEADRTGRGGTLLLEAKLRGGLPNGWGVETEQRFEQGFIAAPDGSRALTDTAMQWLGVLHFDARDSVRAVWQGLRLKRAADAPAGFVAGDGRQRTFSLVFQRRAGFGRNLSVGLSRQSDVPGLIGNRATATEVFAKGSFEWSL